MGYPSRTLEAYSPVGSLVKRPVNRPVGFLGRITDYRIGQDPDTNEQWLRISGLGWMYVQCVYIIRVFCTVFIDWIFGSNYRPRGMQNIILFRLIGTFIVCAQDIGKNTSSCIFV